MTLKFMDPDIGKEKKTGQKKQAKDDIKDRIEKRREERDLKQYRRLTIAFEADDQILLDGLQLLSKKNRRAVGSEIKLMIENRLLEEKIIKRDKDYNISMNE